MSEPAVKYRLIKKKSIQGHVGRIDHAARNFPDANVHAGRYAGNRQVDVARGT